MTKQITSSSGENCKAPEIRQEDFTKLNVYVGIMTRAGHRERNLSQILYFRSLEVFDIVCDLGGQWAILVRPGLYLNTLN